jgi:hypothetical protein
MFEANVIGDLAVLALGAHESATTFRFGAERAYAATLATLLRTDPPEGQPPPASPCSARMGTGAMVVYPLPNKLNTKGETS